MNKFIFLLFACACGTNLQAQNLNVGFKFQKTHTMYWENGLSAQYSFPNFKPDQFYLGFDYITSRLGTAVNSNALKQDIYKASAAWYFRKDKAFQVTTKLNVGYFHADLGNEIFSELPNTAVLISPEFGLSYSLKQIPLVVDLGTGYQMDFQEEGKSPGTFLPLYYHFSLYYKLK